VANVFDAVFQHGDAFDSHSESKAKTNRFYQFGNFYISLSCKD
jgi:hypothetical protein